MEQQGAYEARFYALAVCVLILDQASKWWVVANMRLGEVIALASFMNLRHAENRGAAFSFLADAGGWQRLFLSAVAGLICAWIVWALRRRPPAWEAGALSLVLGGALGNLADRILRGHVVDFLDFHWAVHHFPTFNIADIGIVAGVAMLLVYGVSSHANSTRPQS